MQNRNELRVEIEGQRRSIIIRMTIGLGLVLLAGIILMIVWPHPSPKPKPTPEPSPSPNPLVPTVSAAMQYSAPMEVNFPAPELALENIKGGSETLAAFHDKVVILNNWAIWCPACRYEMPTLAAYYNDHAKDGLMVIAIEAGSPKYKVQQFADEFHLPFTVWTDPKATSLRAFTNRYLPNSYVIDRAGAVRLMWLGEIDRATLERYVTPLLAGD